MKVLQQIAQGSILFLHVAKVYLRVKVNRAEHIAEFSAVMLFNMRQCHVDLLANLIVAAILVQEVKRRLPINVEALSAHRTLNASLISAILLRVKRAPLPGHIAKILYKQHGQDIVLIAGAVDLTAEAVTSLPEHTLDIVTSSHDLLPLFISLWM